MPRFVYRFTGEAAEDFLFLPADPPSRRLEPGDTVNCSEPVEHARLQLVKNSAQAPLKDPQKTAAELPASPAKE